MTSDEFEAAYRAFRRRRPFSSFEIEFVSGNSVRVPHPEAIRREGALGVLRLTDGRFTVFGIDGVVRLTDQAK